jgi:hypothetical protein
MLINGKWVQAIGGASFPTFNPATGEPIANVAAGEKAVPLTLGYIDFAAKPAWLLEVNPAGSVPVAKGEKRGKAGVRKRTTRKAPTHTAAPPLSCPHSSLISPSPFPHTDLASGDWVVDSGVICDWLEDKWPSPALGKTADAPAA